MTKRSLPTRSSSIRVGSKSHQLMVVVWLATTSALLVLLSMFGLTAASAKSNFAAPLHSSELPSTNYAGAHWSISEVRTTQANQRPCYVDEPTNCNPVNVIEVLVTNTNRIPISVSTSDLRLEFPSGATHEAKRFDCPDQGLANEMEKRFGELYSKCPSISKTIVLKAGQTRAVSILFIPQSETLPKLKNIKLMIKEAHRPTAMPAYIPLAGETETSLFPVEGTINLENPVRTLNSKKSNTKVDIEPSNVSIDLNYKNIRVTEGNRLAIIEVKIQSLEGNPDELLQRNFWSLHTGDSTIKPDWVDVDTPRDGEVTLQFTFKPGPTKFELLAGDPSAGNANFANFPLKFPEYS